jgi:FAD/FMN-containing dehydrogenase
MLLDPLILDELVAIVGARHVVTEPAALEPHEIDWRGRYRGSTSCAVHPSSAQQVAAVVRVCRASGLAVVPQGGNTGMSAGALPPPETPNLVLCMDRLNQVLEVDLPGNAITAGAGCTLESIQQQAARVGRCFPMALGSQGSCQIGGNIATNAGGTSVLRYGNMRDLVLGLEVVLPDGRIWNGLRKLRKDNTGYDIKQLFIGAEGTLGVITAAVLKLYPAPQAHVAAWAGVRTIEQAVELLGHLQSRCGERLSGFEVISRGQLELVLQHVAGARDPLGAPVPWNILIDLTDSQGDGDLPELLQQVLGAALEQGILSDVAVAMNERQVNDFWRLRESVSEANRKAGYSVAHDTSVPIARIPEFVRHATAALEARPSRPLVVAVGHVGDGNIHLVAIFSRNGSGLHELQREADDASAVVHEIATRLGGSISAEHGIGSAKRHELARFKHPLELELMLGIKQWLDPGNIMNPGKIFITQSQTTA